MAAHLLEIDRLKINFRVYGGEVHAVDLHRLALRPGETLALVGESGSGKSVTARAILRLLPEKAQVSGSIRFRGQELMTLPEPQMDQMRGKDISMVFQDPMTSLNPVFPVGDALVRALRLHQGISAREARQTAVEALRLVKLPRPESLIDRYPHELSGGMRQRVMIAMALACRPALLIADEPTTALDVTIQAQILRLMSDLRQEVGSAVLFITHNLGVVAQMAESVAVMYAGDVVEWGPVAEIFARPAHPYTALLLAAVPRKGHRERLQAIAGEVPNLRHPPPGCRFAPRCPIATDLCRQERPAQREVAPGQVAACHYPGEFSVANAAAPK